MSPKCVLQRDCLLFNQLMVNIERIEMDVSKNRVTPKWMVKIIENPTRMDDSGVPLFLETPKWTLACNFFVSNSPLELVSI